MKLGKQKQRLTRAPDRLQTGDSWRASKGSSTARGYGYRWQVERMAYLRQHPLCVHCHSLGIVAASTVVDHIEPHRGCQLLFWNQANWQALCRTCHSQWKQQQENHNI